MEEFVIVKMSDFEADLAIARTYLMDNDIDCFINSEYLSVSTTEGTAVKLEVLAEDYLHAKELLIEGGFAKEEDFDNL